MFTTIVSAHFLLLPLVFFILFLHKFPFHISPKMFELFTFKTHDISNLVISCLMSCLVHVCSFIFSHLLYFFYFIYFSPCLLKLVKFLSPISISTFLLLLVLLAVLVAKYNAILEKLQLEKDDKSDQVEEEEEVCGSEDLEMYKVFFGSSETEVIEQQIEVLEEKLEASEVDRNSMQMREKRSDDFSKILNQFERMSSGSEENKKIEPPQGVKIDEIAENQKTVSIFRHGSEVKSNKINVTTSIGGGKVYGSTIKAHSQRLASSPPLDRHDLGTCGSMREEKEWNRTLACKLFQERRGVEGDEGMDSLWETIYENDLPKEKNNKDKEKKKKKKIEDEFSEEEEEGIDDDGQLCCLQALKFSSRKMSLGIGRPSLVKISKAIKGIGWLQHVKRHSKKVHNNGD